jgi:hypothetical protein
VRPGGLLDVVIDDHPVIIGRRGEFEGERAMMAGAVVGLSQPRPIVARQEGDLARAYSRAVRRLALRSRRHSAPVCPCSYRAEPSCIG